MFRAHWVTGLFLDHGCWLSFLTSFSSSSLSKWISRFLLSAVVSSSLTCGTGLVISRIATGVDVCAVLWAAFFEANGGNSWLKVGNIKDFVVSSFLSGSALVAGVSVGVSFSCVTYLVDVGCSDVGVDAFRVVIWVGVVSPDAGGSVPSSSKSGVSAIVLFPRSAFDSFPSSFVLPALSTVLAFPSSSALPGKIGDVPFPPSSSESPGKSAGTTMVVFPIVPWSSSLWISTRTVITNKHYINHTITKWNIFKHFSK